MKSCIFKIYRASLCLFALLAIGACHSKRGAEADISGDAIGAFLQSQVAHVAGIPSPLNLSKRHNGKTDSSLIPSSVVKEMVAPFLSALPTGPSAWASLYKESTFSDSVHHRTVNAYQALSDSTQLNMVDVYINPDTKSIRKMYLQFIVPGTDSSVRKQLIWETDTSFTLITTIDKNEYTTDLLQQKVLWNKP